MPAEPTHQPTHMVYTRSTTVYTHEGTYLTCLGGVQGRSEEWGGVHTAAPLLEGDTAIEEGKDQIGREGIKQKQGWDR